MQLHFRPQQLGYSNELRQIVYIWKKKVVKIFTFYETVLPKVIAGKGKSEFVDRFIDILKKSAHGIL